MKLAMLFSALLLNGCAVLHHVQVGEMDASSRYVAVPIEVKVSEMGVNLGEAKNLSQSVLSNKGDQKKAGDLADTIAMFQMGPRTGAPVYSENYAEKIIYQLHSQCPSGKITGLQSIRETREYPVIKGEIVKVTGFCLTERGS